MKKLLVLILVAGAGYFAYQKFVVGESSQEQKQVQVLTDEFAAVKQQMTQAERSAGATGLDMTSDAGSSMAAAEAVLEKLQELKARLSEKKALAKSADLEREIRAFLDRD